MPVHPTEDCTNDGGGEGAAGGDGEDGTDGKDGAAGTRGRAGRSSSSVAAMFPEMTDYKPNLLQRLFRL